MDIRVLDVGGKKVVAGTPGVRLLEGPDDVIDLLGACGEHGTRSLLLHAENLPERFFDLSSGQAGAILQKLRNYQVRLAVVASEDSVRVSRMFREMAWEESRGGDFRLFEDEPSAQEWLAGGS
jgi:hypothetical protein